MITAELRITGPAAPVAVPTISPEAGRELPRTETRVELRGEEALIHIKATDTTAMRAAHIVEATRIFLNEWRGAR